MRGWLLILGVIGVLFAPNAQAHPNHRHWRPHRRLTATPKASVPHAVATSSCPFDGPDRMFTVVNAGVSNVTLTQIAAIEHATQDESFALRLYYGTPCARFGPGGTPIYLSNGYEPLPDGGSTYQLGGYHAPTALYVQTGLTPYTTWVRAFTHEIMEDLVDPTGTRYFGYYFAEVCDPVENLTYEVDQLRVSDFVTPSWFNGGPAPWDAAHVLTSPVG